MDSTERTTAAFGFAKDSTTQLITLATGVMALTITFFSDLLEKGDHQNNAAHNHIWLMKTSWVLYFVSIIFGVWTLYAMTGTLGNEPGDLRHKSLYSWNIRLPSMIQIITFLFGSGFALAFALYSF
jgi:hypothetical protein